MDLQVLLHSEKNTTLRIIKELENFGPNSEKILRQLPMRVKLLEHREASGQVNKIDISPPAVERKILVIFIVIKINIITLPYASQIISDVFPAPLCWGTVVCKGDTP